MLEKSNVTIKKINVKEGEEVTKGQKLLTFDESDLQESLQEAQENLSDTKAQNSSELRSVKRKVTEAQQTYTSQKKKYAKNVASAKKEYELAKKKASTATNAADKEKIAETLNQAKKSYEQAKSEQETGNKQNLSNIQSAKDQLVSATNSGKKSLREAEKQLKQAKEALEKCSVTAPMSGTITAIGAAEGDTYNGGDLIEISDCSDFQVTTTVDEYDISNVKEGQKVVILTDATGEDELEGKITYVAKTMGSNLSGNSSNSAGAESSGASMGNSGTSSSSGYEVRIKVKTKNEKLRVGMTAKCSIILEEVKDVFAVPYDAIHTNTNGDTVLYVMDDAGMRSEILVSKGMESDYYVEVSGDELNENLQVIIPTDPTNSSKESSEGGSLDGLMGGGMKNSNRGNRQNFGGAPGGEPAGPPGM